VLLNAAIVVRDGRIVEVLSLTSALERYEYGPRGRSPIHAACG